MGFKKAILILLQWLWLPCAFAEDLNLRGQVPRAEFESTRYDFGRIYRGQFVEHRFPFVNKGNGTLLLRGIHSSCGCLETKILSASDNKEKFSFKPGEAGFISMIFDSRSFVGFLERHVTLETNIGSSNPTVTLTIKANILEEISVDPPLLYVGSLDKDGTRSFSTSVRIHSRAEPPFAADAFLPGRLEPLIDASSMAKSFREALSRNFGPVQVLGVESNVPYVRASLGRHDTDPSRLSLLVSVGSAPLPIGVLNSKLTIWNNSTFYKNLELPVLGEVLGHVQLSAKYLEFGVVGLGRSSTQVLSLSSTDKRFQITGVRIELKRLTEMKNIQEVDFFQIKKEKILPPPREGEPFAVGYNLRFQLVYPEGLMVSPQSNRGLNVSGSFVVKTNDPDYKEISIPFFGILRKAE